MSKAYWYYYYWVLVWKPRVLLFVPRVKEQWQATAEENEGQTSKTCEKRSLVMFEIDGTTLIFFG